MRIAQLGLAEYFINEVDESLYLVDVAWLISFDDQGGADHMGGGRDVEEEGLPIFWSCEDGWTTASSFHSNLSDFRRSLKKRRPLSPSRLMNRLKAAMHPVSFIRSFFHLGGFMNIIALVLVGLASMPRLLTMLLLGLECELHQILLAPGWLHDAARTVME